LAASSRTVYVARSVCPCYHNATSLPENCNNTTCCWQHSETGRDCNCQTKKQFKHKVVLHRQLETDYCGTEKEK